MKAEAQKELDRIVATVTEDEIGLKGLVTAAFEAGYRFGHKAGLDDCLNMQETIHKAIR